MTGRAADFAGITEEPRATAADLDRLAGLAWRAGDLDRCLGLLALARMAFPADAATWDTRQAAAQAGLARRERQRNAGIEAAR